MQNLIDLAISMGASDAKPIASKDILVEPGLAKHCVEPRCENYGLSMSCPPNVSGPPGFRKLQKSFTRAVAVRIVVPSAALFSQERVEIMRLLHETVAAIERAAVDMGYSGSKAFAGGSCKSIFCHNHAECRVLSKKGECRHPNHARPSMSGYGINVAELMKTCGWPADIAAHESESDSMSWVAGLVMIGE